MRLNLFSKLFLAIALSVALAGIGLLVFINWSFQHSFANYMLEQELEQVEPLAESLAEFYQRYGSLSQLQRDSRQWRRMLADSGLVSGPPQHRGPPGHFPPPRHGGDPRGVGLNQAPAPSGVRPPAPLSVRVGLAGSDKKPLINAPHHDRPGGKSDSLAYVGINSDGETVGYVTVLQTERHLNESAQHFIDNLMRQVSLSSVVLFLLVLVVTLLLARHFLGSIRALATGAEALSGGDLDHRIKVNASDELGQLARDFNSLADSLNQQQQLRQQWLADISHELRTPIAVLRGEIEAIQDGIRQPTQDRIRSLHRSVLSLGKLVEDLYQLSKSDSGLAEIELEPTDLLPIIEDAVTAIRPRMEQKEIHLNHDFSKLESVTIRASALTIYQLFDNLLENSFRYTDAGGRVEIAVAQNQSHVEVQIRDSSPGVSDADLPHLLDRLYRVDKSRSREFGGSGLGLSICDSIVKAHGGELSVSHSSLGGLEIGLRFVAC